MERRRTALFTAHKNRDIEILEKMAGRFRDGLLSCVDDEGRASPTAVIDAIGLLIDAIKANEEVRFWIK